MSAFCMAAIPPMAEGQAGGAVTKYYFLGGARVAMRQGGAVYYSLTDHLGSTSVTTDSLGNAVAELRYKPWGETRLAGGTTPSKYQFTGQYSIVPEFGLYYYNARWYDGSLGRFVQADTVVPDHYNTLDWDRYAYARSNPVRYTDPSGHKVTCDGENNNKGCQGVTSNDLSNLVRFDYGWTLKGRWSKHNIGNLLNYTASFANQIFNVTGKNGTTWIRNHLGNAVLKMGAVSNFIMKTAGASGMVPTNSDVLLPQNFTEYTLIHEMGHVFDNNIKGGVIPATYNGGGPSDAMVAAMGGHPENNFPRWVANNQWYFDNVAGDNPWPLKDYGNHGVADDFAETFAYTLMGGFVPDGRQLWMTSFLNLLP
jgi:RHS repeat-associated protein